MKKYVRLLMGLLIAGWWSASCSSDHDDIPSEASGKGGVRIGLSTDTGFSSRAGVDESEYKNLNIYTVQILKDDVPLADYKTTTYADLANKVLLLNGGSYTVKAFHGEDKPVSTTSMYVEGKKDFIVKNDTTEVSFTCKPVCAKVIVDFDADLDEYFSDYYVTFKTKAMGETAYPWEKDHQANTPVYMKVENEEQVSAIIHLKAKDGVKAEATISRRYTLSPLQVKTITIAPAVSESAGTVGIEITVDETTNDKNVEIIVPSDWLNE